VQPRAIRPHPRHSQRRLGPSVSETSAVGQKVELRRRDWSSSLTNARQRQNISTIFEAQSPNSIFPMSGNERLPLATKLLLGARCALVLSPWLVHLFAADIVLSAVLPLSTLLPDFCYNLSSHIAESVWRGIQYIFVRVNHANIVVSGAEKLPPNESAIVISNHVEWTDFYMIQELAIRSNMLGRCRWFAKQQLKWVPFLGWGLWAMGMPLVSRKWTNDQQEMNRVFRGPLERRWPICESIWHAIRFL
jgi:1-acyl-sn-glycerol-3-phosphate acyltransferase